MPLVTIARVAVAAATYMFDKPYDYVIPKALEGKVVPGVRVTAPFGRGNRCSEALVLSTYEGERSADLKVIDAVLDDAPVLDQGEMRLAFWLPYAPEFAGGILNGVNLYLVTSDSVSAVLYVCSGLGIVCCAVRRALR